MRNCREARRMLEAHMPVWTFEAFTRITNSIRPGSLVTTYTTAEPLRYSPMYLCAQP